MKRTFRYTVIPALICAIASIAWAQEVTQPVTPAPVQDGVKLEFKYAVGDCLRYKTVIDMNMTIPGAPDSQSQIPVKMVFVTNQTVDKVLPSGDAEVTTKVESGRLDLFGASQDMPAGSSPTAIQTVGVNGEVKSVRYEGTKNAAAAAESMMPMNDLMALSTVMVFPATLLKVDETWTTENTLSGGHKLKVEGKLTSTDATVGAAKEPAVTFTTTTTGDMAVGGQVNPASGAAAVPSMVIEGMRVDSKGYFSVAKGYLVKLDGKGSMTMVMGGGAGSNAMRIGADYTCSVYMLPPAKPAK